MPFLLEAAILLGSAVIAVPLFQRMGLGSILGYLFVGVLLGPSLFGVIAEPEAVMHLAEIGVVMLLFVIGLELEPKRLWSLRKRLFGFGGMQLALCGMLLTPLGWLLGLETSDAILLGLILALSSTAFALQVLTEHQHLATPHGQLAFAILLFQDLAVIPLLALLPVFAGGFDASPGNPWLVVGRGIGMVMLVILVGRVVFPRVLKLVARSELREVFTAAALLLVLGTALIMEQAGLSMALGAFLAGVLLADTPWRHELEANIEPFKGILLGLFFIGVGMSVDLSLVGHQLPAIIGLTLALLLAKFLVLTLIGLLARLPKQALPQLATIIAQGGEFDFVLLAAAVSAGVFDQRIASLCVAAVTLSMAVTPLLYQLGGRLGAQLRESRPWDSDFGDHTPPVLIAGLGRFGQIVARMLSTQNIAFTALDPNIAQVEFIRRFGSRIYYADATRLELLHAAGASEARVLVIAVDDSEAALTIARLARAHFPQLQVYARARNRHHAWQLMELGVEHVVRETFAASLEMCDELLRGMGYPGSTAGEAVRTFREFDTELFHHSYQHRDDNQALLHSDRAAMAELQALFQHERHEQRHNDTDTDDSANDRQSSST
ncbi:monovalent cation:proton antiporter-2 (CPA2) family protein [Kushneria phosphatilytica]|uniref:Potassium transporter n=1 Tax=Kushneria phosphatilytica TaxID=657387 RepID=A0A1S1NWP1_9GAMM|nr:monovalent cation:proton antiporter-2 (CPA2) family protein [Kushneria phosphatilytica]OHV11970.1 potassium transporter [Kushneria phosphatilytica]QEL11155.1 potassium transporter [Kushneria phosphatilytica]